MKIPLIIYVDAESLLEKIRTRDTNPEESSTTKLCKHAVCDYLLPSHCSFNSSKNKHNFYKSVDSMKMFFADLKNPCNRNNQLWEKGNNAIDKWEDLMSQN